ncbi:hypothetical protein A4A49_51697 [Nicotiana attenuata]|uniref:RNase H type-1 domain-containing protein n=1 Tax=Nicotiana attenuata TaxID=49451 RepID=A0A1J6IEX5_NICAT|nr:hypothetical protein A4A49_51697 [Nicotiana attenuata]
MAESQQSILQTPIDKSVSESGSSVLEDGDACNVKICPLKTYDKKTRSANKSSTAVPDDDFNSQLSSNKVRKQLLKELKSDIDHLNAKKISMDSEDDELISILNADMRHQSEDWTNCQSEIPALILDVELLIYKDLIDFIRTSKKAGIGCIVRDSSGDFIFAFSIPIQANSSSQAKATAVRFGVEWCTQQGYSNIHVETDSLIVTSILIKQDTNNLKLFISDVIYIKTLLM